ncbi:DUF2852 domain-containing protein [Neotabrizicola sp. VNH66]|uniref:DUF2852 domain-containing protein n=1 Tax=Neotabrizicola sp. VNH66 TaxID=3400918 RepID=UPI003C027CDB
MNTTTTFSAPSGPLGWLRRAEAWLDARGRWAWIAAMVAGFVFVWPVGLALLAYMIWGKKMFGKSCRNGHDRHHHAAREWAREWGRPDRAAFRPSGNAAFDNYKSDTLRRLEEEQEAFESFLKRLREARDKQEFDRFMDERARAGRDVTEADTATAAAETPADARRGEY